jgi:hypothetical protein
MSPTSSTAGPLTTLGRGLAGVGVGLALLLGGCAAPATTPVAATAPAGAAERYAACLTEHGVEAIVHDGRVLTRMRDGQQPQAGNARPPGEAAPTTGPDADLAKAEAACRAAVPDYVPRNDDEKA